ncbi:hypothetical protein ACU4IU_00230 [Brevibacterium sp. CSND-B09]|uniref:hypothetical protein n=1 Tax=Brevibacterium sp. CSND-B09 TaxID=3462571 RepID=UPI00406A61B2
MEFLHGDTWNVDNIHATARKFVAAVESGDGATAHLDELTLNSPGGYVVGGLVSEVVIPVEQFDGREAFYAIAALLKRAEDENVIPAALGVWVDGGLVYVDASTIFPEYQLIDALYEAHERKELAIFSRASGECITLASAVTA